MHTEPAQAHLEFVLLSVDMADNRQFPHIFEVNFGMHFVRIEAASGRMIWPFWFFTTSRQFRAFFGTIIVRIL